MVREFSFNTWMTSTSHEVVVWHSITSGLGPEIIQ